MAGAWSSWRLRLAALWLLLTLACFFWAGQRLLTGHPLETNLLALLPPTERNPQAEAAVNALAENLGNRAVFLIGHQQPEEAHRLARQFAENLRASGAFSAVIDVAPKADASMLTGFYASHQAALLTGSDRKALTSPNFDPAVRLARRIYQPFSGGIATPLADDPLGLLQNWLTALPLTQSRLSIEDGQLVARGTDTTWVLVLGELPGSAYDGALQTKVVQATESASKALQQSAGSRLLHTGGVFYGAAARSSAEKEVDLIGAGSLAGILLMMWWLFRSLRPLVLGMLTVAIGLAFAFAATFAVYGQIHLITLVFGASLIGEAVDYAIQVFAAQLDAGKEWQAELGIQRLLRPLAVALATSLIGYAALALTPFPAIGQIALFAFAGLAAAWISVILLLPLLTRQPMLRDAAAATRLPRLLLELWRRYVTPVRALALIATLLVLAVPGWLQLKGDDDIRLLITRPAHLQAEESQIRSLAGFANGSRFFLVEGRDWEEVLQREEKLAERLLAAGLRAPLGVSSFVPSSQRQAENHALLLQRLNPPAAISKTFAATGLRDDVAARWLNAMQRPPATLTPTDWLANQISAPFRYLVMNTATGAATIVVPQGETADADFPALTQGLEGVTAVDKAASVSALFHQYRLGAAGWLPIAMLIVAAVLVWRYGLRNGVVVLLPTVLGMSLALAVYGYIGLPVTLFSLMGLMLVLGVGANYAVFLFEAGDRAPAPFAGVLLSAATTLLSFGLLSLSSMPALKHFGLMLLIGISAAVVLSPLVLTLGEKNS